MSEITDLVTAYRSQLLAGDTLSLDALQESFIASRKRLLDQIDALVSDIEKNGVTRSSDALKLARSEQLIGLIETELARIGSKATPIITQEKRKAITLAIEQAQQLALAQTGSTYDARKLQREWTTLPVRQIEDITAQFGSASPVTQAFSDLEQASRDAITSTIAQGVTEGINTETLAEKLGQVVEIGFRRAMMISRQSVFGANRRAMEAIMSENADVLMGKRRLCAFLPNTCIACLGLHNHIYRIDEVVPYHVNDRCITLPVPIDPADIDFGSGEDYLRSLDEKTRRMMFGNERARTMWENGDVALTDFVKVVPNETWGPATQIMGTDYALAQAQARGHVATPRTVKPIPASDGGDLVRVR